MARIQLEGVTKRYPDGTEAVAGVDLDIADGELLVLVGPSGSGKSTVLRMMVGLEDITDGDLLIGGERANAWPPRERNLAMVFQNYGLYPHLSVRENLAFPLRLARKDEDEVRRRVAEVADTLALGEHLERRPSQLSGAQRQRVALGRAIVRRADGFLLDEPLSTLEGGQRLHMRTQIARLQRQAGVTTVYSTHDQADAMTIGDRVAVLHRGRVRFQGTIREMMDSVRGKVWTIEVPTSELHHYRGRYLETGLLREGASVRLRVVADTIDDPHSHASEPTLEDAYIRLMRGDREDREDRYDA